MKIVGALILLSLMACRIVFAQGLKSATAQDWLLMSKDEKALCIVDSMKLLAKSGVPFGRTPAQYASMIDVLADKPELRKAEIVNILSSTIYLQEPQARTVLDKIGKKAGQPAKA